MFPLMIKRFMLVTSNYPPEAGGPSKFARNFSVWARPQFESVNVISTHPIITEQKIVDGVTLNFISRKHHLVTRFFKTVIAIKKCHQKGTLVLANGAFFEMLFASVVFKIEYRVKLPGDIVWEHARRNGETSLDLLDFQNSKLTIKNVILRRIFSLSLTKAESVIVPSTKVLKICLDWGVAPEKITVIFNGVDTEVFKPNASSVKTYDLITVCRLVEIKRVHEIIDLAYKLGMKLLIVGDGELKESLEKQSETLSNVATFHGLATQAELPELYNSAKIFVLNSEFEVGTPYALIEARSCGLVCIANEIDGSSDVINDRVDGFLFRKDSSKSLESVLYEASNLGLAYHSFSKAARDASINEFSEQIVYKRILSEMLNKDNAN